MGMISTHSVIDYKPKNMSHIKTETINTEKRLDTKQQIEVFIEKEYLAIFEEIVKECNIQIVKRDIVDPDDKYMGYYYTLELDADDAYWFGRNYQNAIDEFRKTK